MQRTENLKMEEEKNITGEKKRCRGQKI